MLTSFCLISTISDVMMGEQRLYKFPNGWGLSLVKGRMTHGRWEAAVLDPTGNLSYETPLTSDVEQFEDEDEANAFIEKAAAYFGNLL